MMGSELWPCRAKGKLRSRWLLLNFGYSFKELVRGHD